MRVIVGFACLVTVAWADKLGHNYQPVGQFRIRALHPTPNPPGNGIGDRPGFTRRSEVGSVAQESSGPAEYTKVFYTVTAPQHEFDDSEVNQQVEGSLKKTLRVVFIKAPENKDLENALLALVKKVAIQKTAIYVLHKQTDIIELSKKLNNIRRNNKKNSEVYFVKYRTPQDAMNAQQQIQSQYDSLGGTTQSHNGGVASVLNVASNSPVSVLIVPL